MSGISAVLCGKYCNYAEDADFRELCGSASPHPVRCHGNGEDLCCSKIESFSAHLRMTMRNKLSAKISKCFLFHL